MYPNVNKITTINSCLKTMLEPIKLVHYSVKSTSKYWTDLTCYQFKGKVHPKMKILSLSTYCTPCWGSTGWCFVTVVWFGTLFTPLTHGWAGAPTTDRVHANVFSLAAAVKVSALKRVSFQINLGFQGFRKRRQVRHIVFLLLCLLFYVLKQVSICFICLGEWCNTVLLWSCRNVL